MRNHPALAVKYLLPQYTRGIGVEFGDGLNQGTTPLYAHFKKPHEVLEEGVVDSDAPGPCDFVLLCEGPSPMENSQWRRQAIELLKDDGYCCIVRDGKLTVHQRAATAHGAWLRDVDQSIPGPSVCVVRYGGFGDMVQAANCLPALKREGYRVYVMTTPQGADILKHDPHVDGFLLQDHDQVPNNELTGFWEVQAARFDRFVNLSESVEGTLLAYAGRANHAWPEAVRRKRLGTVNYLEWTSELAQVPYASESRFYPSELETAAVSRFLTRVRLSAAGATGPGPVNAPPVFTILWVLAGSSIHKVYPHQDDAMARVLRAFPDAAIILCGDELCQILEQGWENNPRVSCLSGKIGIRETLALAQRVDCVVGPETGVLNSAAFEPNGKVVMLSHSSPTNLTLHWVNTEALEPPSPCYPCHRLHHGREYCVEHKPSGAAQCAWDIDPFRVFSAIGRQYSAWRQLREMTRAAA